MHMLVGPGEAKKWMWEAGQNYPEDGSQDLQHDSLTTRKSSQNSNSSFENHA